MASIVVSDVGGHHFHNTMFGGGSAHSKAQESPAANHTPVRPSPQANATPALRVVPPADVPMPDSGPLPPSSTPSQHGSTFEPASQPRPQAPPKSPRVRPQSEQAAEAAVGHAPNASTQHASPPPASPAQESPISALHSPLPSVPSSPRPVIKVKSLAHIQSFAADESTRSLTRRRRRDPEDSGPRYEISDMPVADIIEMVAGLLTKITTTNDRQHEHLHRHIPPPESSPGMNQQTTSVLAFHGKNVPSISILSYLSRIHKYCPTTYEVFLSLLVYFDRMTERVNPSLMLSLRQASEQSLDRLSSESDERHQGTVSQHLAQRTAPQSSSASTQAATPPPSGSLGKPSDTSVQGNQPPSPPQQIDRPLEGDPYSLSHFFVVDSFNIHRLVIAGVTCASKFFSDVFYTNSRYAKV